MYSISTDNAPQLWVCNILGQKRENFTHYKFTNRHRSDI